MRHPHLMPRSRSAPKARPVNAAARPAAFAPAAGAPALAVAAFLGLLLAARAALCFAHDMSWWGLGVGRFTAPALTWSLWSLTALAWMAALVPGTSERLASFAARPRGGSRAAWLLALALAALVAALPDTLHYTGDFQLRQETVTLAKAPAEMFPQAMPLDVALHFTVPSWLLAHAGLAARDYGRMLGALDAALLVVLTFAFVRALELPRAAGIAAGAVVLFCGALGLFTGYSKAFAEMALVAVAVGAFGERALRTGRGLLPLGIAATLGTVLHRSGVAFAAALGLIWVAWAWRHARTHARSLDAIAGLALPLVSLIAIAPVLRQKFAVLDAVHLLPPETRQLGVLGNLGAGTHLLDAVNVALLISPFVALLPVLLLMLLPARGTRPAGAGLALAAQALPFTALLLFVHPQQGTFRDWDVFVPAGVALALFAAWAVGEALRPARAWALAPAVAVASFAGGALWLAHLHDTPRALERVHAWTAEPPHRADTEYATTWDFLATQAMRTERWADAVSASERAVHYAPSPRLYMQWGMAASMTGNFELAQQKYAESVRLDPALTMGWLGLASASSLLNDVATCEDAAAHLRRLDPQPSAAAGDRGVPAAREGDALSSRGRAQPAARNTSTALCPPNPNAFDTTTRTRASRAVSGT